jgi:D-2-hydroxyacid dehydrogenase (NADP+)
MKVCIVNSEHDAHEFAGYLRTDFPDVEFFSAREEREVVDSIEDAEILVVLRISDELLGRAKNLKWIHTTITGTDHIESLTSFLARKEILLTSSRGIHGAQMSEMAVLFMIALNRQFPRLLRNQGLRVWERWPTPLLYQKTAGILGVGAIGQSIAEKCKAFGMTVLGIDPFPREVASVDRFYGPEELHGILPMLDYLISVAPSMQETRDLLNWEAFSRMKTTAFFINLGRGDVVDEDSLVQALRERRIAGAALDTFRREPLPPEHPFWGMDNVIVTPHVGGKSDTYVRQAVGIFRENLTRFLLGERKDLINLVSRG